MSGHKRKFISITEDEYRRLHEADMKLRSVSEFSQQRISGIVLESDSVMWESIRATQARQNQFTHTVGRLGAEIQAVEQQTGQALLAYEQQLSGALQGSKDQLWQQTESMIDEVGLRFEQQIAEAYHANQETVNYLASLMTDAQEAEAHKAEIAGMWLDAAVDSVNLIESTYPLESDTQSELEILKAELYAAESNIQIQFYDAVLIAAQQVVTKASSLRVQLERAIYDAQLMRRAAINQLQQLLIMADEYQYAQAIDLEGALLPYEINVDFWSGGKLKPWKDETARLAYHLEQDTGSTNLPRLKKLLRGEVQELRMQLEELIRSARWNALNSQLRINIADLAVQALEAQGFELVESGYSSQDTRRGYTALVKDYSGNEVQIHVEPIEGTGIENELHIPCEDAGIRTEYELRSRDMEITDALNGYGLQVFGMPVETAQQRQVNDRPGEKPASIYNKPQPRDRRQSRV